MVRCGVAGFFDPVAGYPCRMVGWSSKNLSKHFGLVNLCNTISNHFKEVAPEVWEYQKSKCHNSYNMGDSCFSTLTLNYDFRTAAHKDKGDLENSLSTLTILEDEEDNYEGFYTGLPEYKIMFDIRDGDTLIFDNDKIIERVTPKRGRCLIFNGSLKHTSTSPSLGPRIIINNNIR